VNWNNKGIPETASGRRPSPREEWEESILPACISYIQGDRDWAITIYADAQATATSEALVKEPD
jgi:hypothetical protein